MFFFFPRTWEKNTAVRKYHHKEALLACKESNKVALPMAGVCWRELNSSFVIACIYVFISCSDYYNIQQLQLQH